MLKRPGDGLWAGLVVGILAVTAMMAFHVDINGGGTADSQAVLTSNQAARAFASAWQRMATSTWSVASTYTRTLTNGQTFRAVVKQVQQPPDYVDESVGFVTARINGRAYVCASADAGRISDCRDTGPAPAFDVLAAQQVQAVRSEVLGSHLAYQVQAQGGSCYQLFLAPGATPSNWGNRARFCFDPQTGGPAYTGFYKDAGSDVTQATRVSSAVDPLDLQVPRHL